MNDFESADLQPYLAAINVTVAAMAELHAAEALREWADRHGPDGPTLHARAVDALDELRSLTAQMPLKMVDGRTVSVADVIGQLFVAARTSIDHHQRLTDHGGVMRAASGPTTFDDPETA